MQYSCLPRSFFDTSPDRVAQQLLGKLIVRRFAGELLAGRIVETEAYFGDGDEAAHAFGGRTARNEVLFGPPGHSYVYFIYGVHHCLNVACEPEGKAGCVLIRALEPIAGVETMAALRKLPAGARRLLASGPGRLCQALALTRLAHNGIDLCDESSELVLADDGFRPPLFVAGSRIGIRKAAELAARYCVEGSPFLSARPG